jgi:hypothetical protein
MLQVPPGRHPKGASPLMRGCWLCLSIALDLIDPLQALPGPSDPDPAVAYLD